MNKIKNKKKLTIYIILLVGFIVRIIGIGSFPNALNADEASSGYEAFSILNYGIDRNGNFLPVFLESWGSGQNALYTYLIIPFVKIFGLNAFSIRLPMAIIGCISLIVMYKILREITDEKTTIIGLIFFTITPWHIMKSRWGLESNIFPDLILYAVFFIIKFIKTKDIKNMYISSFILGLSAYSYGTSYFFLPIFVLGILLYLFKKKYITIKNIVGILSTIFIISLPIILFIIINTFDLKPIKLLFSIPRIEENRYEEISSIFSKNFIANSLKNFIDTLKIIITQTDGLAWNSFHLHGLVYTVSLPFFILGIIINIKKRSELKNIFNIWFIAAVLLTFVTKPNINRINVIIFPIIYFTIIGICVSFEKIELLKIILPIIYLGLFLSFVVEYFITDWSKFNTFNKVENTIKYVQNIDKNIYFEYSFKEPYIYICFYNKINTNEFVKTVKYKNNKKGFESVESFGKYFFYILENKEEDGIFVVKKDNEDKYNFDENWNRTYIDDFVIISKN